MQIKFFWVLLLLLSIVFASGEEASAEHDLDLSDDVDVVILNEKNFEHDTQAATGATTGDWFVKFYAPWCGHCVKLEPTWKQLAQAVHEKGVNVAKVDVTQNEALRKRFGVNGFPTLLFFSKGKVYKYADHRTLDKLTAFASGGYKNAEGTKLSPPAGPVASVLPTVQELKKAGSDLVKGKLPEAKNVLYALIAVAALLFFSSFAVVSLLFKGPKRSVKKAD